jgi:hypothetical protein
MTGERPVAPTYSDTDESEWLVRVIEPIHDLLELFGRRRCDNAFRRKGETIRLVRNRNIGGQVEVYGSRHRRLRDRQSLTHLIERAVRGDIRCPLHQRPHHRFLVKNLMGVYAFEGRCDLAGQNNNRGTVEQRLRDAGGRVRDTRAKCCDEDPRFTRELECGVSHHPGPKLLLGQNELDAGLAKSVQKCKHFTTGYTESLRYAALPERLRNDCGGLRHLWLPWFENTYRSYIGPMLS